MSANLENLESLRAEILPKKEWLSFNELAYAISTMTPLQREQPVRLNVAPRDGKGEYVLHPAGLSYIKDCLILTSAGKTPNLPKPLLRPNNDPQYPIREICILTEEKSLFSFYGINKSKLQEFVNKNHLELEILDFYAEDAPNNYEARITGNSELLEKAYKELKSMPSMQASIVVSLRDFPKDLET